MSCFGSRPIVVVSVAFRLRRNRIGMSQRGIRPPVLPCALQTSCNKNSHNFVKFVEWVSFYLEDFFAARPTFLGVFRRQMRPQLIADARRNDAWRGKWSTKSNPLIRTTYRLFAFGTSLGEIYGTRIIQMRVFVCLKYSKIFDQNGFRTAASTVCFIRSFIFY